MLTDTKSIVAIREIEKKDLDFLITTYGNYESVVGHEDMANLLGVPFNRTTLRLVKNDVLYVAQYSGPRLPEGATELPEGASFKYYKVKVLDV